MKTRVLMATVGGAAAALTAGVMWTAPSASAGSDFCNSLPPAQVHDCSAWLATGAANREGASQIAGLPVPCPRVARMLHAIMFALFKPCPRQDSNLLTGRQSKGA
jgi:hypothetical protein